MTCGIYAIIGPNGNMYVGSSTNIEERFGNHRRLLNSGRGRHSVRFKRAWKKYGVSAFIFAVIEECDAADLVDRENAHLKTLRPAYNVDLSVSGVAGCTRSDEARARMSEAAKRRWLRPEEREAQALRTSGRKQSPDEIEKRRLANIGKKRTPEQCEKFRVAFAKRVRPKGIKPTPETRARLSAAQIAFANSDAGRESKRRAWLTRLARLKGE